jgi:UDP-N-acetylmuramoylalanine--D-glutamate ligase
VILNLTPDHLKRHGDMDGYGAMKCRLFDGMGPDQYAVVPAGDERLLRLAEGRGGTRLLLGGLPGVVRRGRTVVVETPAGSATFSLEGFAVPGEHNLDNAATAALMALLGGVPAETIQAALPGLQALPHRMEVVADLGGVLWINDSKATNLDAAEVGMKGLDRMAVVLLGGERKGPGFGALAPFLAKHRAVVVFGGDGALISDELREAGVPHQVVPWLEEAVDLARKLAQPGDAVLLSPGCASFDQFRNFEHRGEVFRDLVARLRGSP